MKYWVVKNGRILGKYSEEEADEIVSKDMGGDVEIYPEFDHNGKPSRVGY